LCYTLIEGKELKLGASIMKLGNAIKSILKALENRTSSQGAFFVSRKRNKALFKYNKDMLHYIGVKGTIENMQKFGLTLPDNVKKLGGE
jgi:hypothetical protein